MPSQRRPPKVYVAGPITSSGNLTENVRHGISVGNLLLRDGVIPFVPHLSELWNYVTVVGYETWLYYDKEWIRSCDALLRLPGRSRGATREVRWANKLSIPVFYSYEELMKWKDEVFLTGRKSILPKATPSSRSKQAKRSLKSNGKNTNRGKRR
jgi:hypothetical protein